MRTIVLVAPVLAGLVASLTPALAEPPTTDGLVCHFATAIDATAEPGTQTGELSGGPVVVTQADGTTPESGTLTCRIQVSSDATVDHNGSGPAVSSHGTLLVTAGPAVISYVAGPDANVFLCSEFTDDSDGVTYYWDDANATWSTSAAVPCGLTIGSAEPTPEERLVDGLVCPMLTVVFPTEGDVVLPEPVGAVWDCPPYGNG